MGRVRVQVAQRRLEERAVLDFWESGCQEVLAAGTSDTMVPVPDVLQGSLAVRPNGPTTEAPTTMDAYDYRLPPEAIAQHPVEPRSAARLLVGPAVDGNENPVHATMAALPSLLRPGDVLVVNDTRVLAARLELRKATGRVGRGPAPGARRRRRRSRRRDRQRHPDRAQHGGGNRPLDGARQTRPTTAAGDGAVRPGRRSPRGRDPRQAGGRAN